MTRQTGIVQATSNKKVAGGKTSYSYKVLLDSGEEVWVGSLTDYNADKGDRVEFTTEVNGRGFTNLTSLEIIPSEEKAEAKAPAAQPAQKVVNVNYGGGKTPDTQKIISRQFLMNHTLALMNYAAATGQTVEDALAEFKAAFPLTEEFLYNNAAVTGNDVAKVVDNALNSKLDNLVGAKKTAKK